MSARVLTRHSVWSGLVRLFDRSGLDLKRGALRNSLEAGVIEPAMSKLKSIQGATEAAITILRIDDMIKLENKEQQQGGDGHGH